MTTKKTLRWECLAPGNGYCTDCTCDHDDLAAIPVKREGRSPLVFPGTESGCCPKSLVDLDSGLKTTGNSGPVKFLGLWLFYG
ncbi:hypothetical protein [Oscillatoria sp. HE19RPO]|uniref:hypothetical protein n=1 Tax=Oscillatoria sp. HE19RPO TaxID=2954806 RepID=UPI0020C34955|nr:hypothetical protein [Oscillatoria sp. HE19RPO]